MYCESCGSYIPDDQSFCTNCGSPAPKPEEPVILQAPVIQQAVQPAEPAVQPVPVVQQVAQPVQPAPQPVAQPIAQPVVQPAVQPVPQQAQPVYQQPVYQQAAQPVQQVYQQPVYAQPVIVTAAAAPAKPKNGAATAGLVFGILTFVFAWIPFLPYLLGLFGLIFSIIGIAKKKAPGKGKAIAGLILTVLGSIIAFVFQAFIWTLIGSALSDSLGGDFDSFDWSDIYDTGYSVDSESPDYVIDGDFVTTDKGYVSGVLHIEGFRVDF